MLAWLLDRKTPSAFSSQNEPKPHDELTLFEQEVLLSLCITKGGDLNSLKILLKHFGACLSSKISNDAFLPQFHPLMRAVNGNHFHALEMLIAHGASLSDGKMLFETAIYANHDKIVRILLSAGIPPPLELSSSDASRRLKPSPTNPELIKLLWVHGFDFNKAQLTPCMKRLKKLKQQCSSNFHAFASDVDHMRREKAILTNMLEFFQLAGVIENFQDFGNATTFGGFGFSGTTTSSSSQCAVVLPLKYLVIRVIAKNMLPTQLLPEPMFFPLVRPASPKTFNTPSLLRSKSSKHSIASSSLSE
eukprot:CAMPEP_0201560740 /NCGR_PEP_ID=MMETSP0173_2-20130828/78428_1 /ASSEMBLY_ACC=CAM_ASM_000268 /TAXON_ID=218659 /ORGANISM="Vexillifera sp., Strain DIVA3 564/2" /LENGTH=303 /DNA_ID=CAMNT_0047975199 /DNA_START=901 /DNA_END=1809 /DNA_ORIENTATION=-